MATDLVTTAEVAARWSGFSSLAAGEQSALVTAASLAVERYLGRSVGTVSLDEVHYPDLRDGRFWLKAYPVASITRVAGNYESVMSVANTSTTNSFAYVFLTTTGDIYNPTVTGMTLTRTASGIPTTSALLFSTYVTLADLAVAIDALGGGWDATVESDRGTFATADLARDFGAKGAMAPDQARIMAYTDLLDPWQVDHRTGQVQLMRWPRFNRLDHQVRVSYSAGYATASVPGDIKAATITLVKMLRESSLIGVYSEESLGDRSYKLSQAFVTTFNQPPAQVAMLLSAHKDRRFL